MLQEKPSKENIKHFKTLNIFTYSIFVGRFSPLGYGSAFSLWIRIHPTSTRVKRQWEQKREQGENQMFLGRP
jgi:hypothetical protein